MKQSQTISLIIINVLTWFAVTLMAMSFLHHSDHTQSNDEPTSTTNAAYH